MEMNRTPGSTHHQLPHGVAVAGGSYSSLHFTRCILACRTGLFIACRPLSPSIDIPSHSLRRSSSPYRSPGISFHRQVHSLGPFPFHLSDLAPLCFSPSLPTVPLLYPCLLPSNATNRWVPLRSPCLRSFVLPDSSSLSIRSLSLLPRFTFPPNP
jgi:hypothetical protein